MSCYCPREGYKVASSITLMISFAMLTSYCPREGYKVASFPMCSRLARKSVTVPVRGIRLHHEQQNEAIRMVKDVTVPVRGIRLHPEPALCNVSREPRVTVPVRGSRGDRCQRQKQGATAGAALRVLQAPCRCAAKIGKAQEEKVASGQGGTTRCRATSYCPREGYKVASCCLCPSRQC